jgi:hypothetical protein
MLSIEVVHVIRLFIPERIFYFTMDKGNIRKERLMNLFYPNRNAFNEIQDASKKSMLNNPKQCYDYSR